MREAGREFRCVHLTLDLDVGLRRILGRAKVEGRADDANEAFIRRRMQLFIEKTMPVIEQYKAQRKVVEIDGSCSVDEVYEEMKNVLS